MSEVGRGLWISSCPTPLVQQGHLQQAAQGHVQMAFKDLQEGHSTSSLGKLWQCLVTLTGEKCFLVFKIQGCETSHLVSSTLYFCPRLPAWEDSGAFSVFLVWGFVFTFHLCCQSVLQETALLQKMYTFVLTWRHSFPGVVLPCSCSSGLDHVLHAHCGGKHCEAPCSKQ